MTGWRIVGWIMMILSVLWIVACTGCSGYLIVTGVSQTNPQIRGAGHLQAMVAGLIGGFSIVAGLVVLAIGRMIRGPAKPRAEPPPHA